MVEIDRGTMPIERADVRQTSFERKMRAYLTAYAEKQHEQRFGWKAYRVLVVTTNERRRNAMMDVLRNITVLNSPGSSLFFFATRDQLRACDPLMLRWQATGGNTQLIV